MNQLVANDGHRPMLGPAVFHARLRAEDAYVETDGKRTMPAVPDATVGTIPLSLTSASRLAGTRALPQPAHTISGDVE